jgi:predicted DNA-binding transcriptional regulator AlpA
MRPPADHPERLLTVEQVAQITGFTRSQLARFKKFPSESELEIATTDRGKFFTRSSVREYTRQNGRREMIYFVPEGVTPAPFNEEI